METEYKYPKCNLMITQDGLISAMALGDIDEQSYATQNISVVEIQAQDYGDYLIGAIYKGTVDGKPSIEEKPSPNHIAKNGEWILTEEGSQALWNTIRMMRNELLKNSDWTQMPDSPLSDEEKQKWKDWRIMLRDFPSFYTDEQIMEAFVEIQRTTKI